MSFKRVSVVTNIAAPYRLLQMEQLQKKLGSSAIVKIFFTQGMTRDRKWKLDTSENLTYLKRLFTFGKYGPLNFGLINIVRNSDIVLIGGYEQPSYIILAFLCRLARVPYVIFFDGITPTKINHHQDTSFLNKVKRFIISRASAFLLNGEVSKKYFENILKADPSKIYNQFLSVNLTGSLKLADIYSKSIFFRKKYNISSDQKIVLYSGRLIEIKNIELLIHSVSQLNKCVLFISGDGVLYNQLKALVTKLSCRAIFLGHLEQDDLSFAYSSADCLVLPSNDEPWGLVVNEALCHSTPVVVSTHVGCHFDLVINRVNGIVIDELTVTALAAAISSALKITKSQVFKSSVKILNQWNLVNSAQSIKQMIDDILTN